MTTQQQPVDSKMSSLSEECNELKHKYDECFNAWFTDKFLKGDKNLTVCDDLMKLYSDCVKNAMKKKNIDLKEVEREALELNGKKKDTQMPR